MSPSGRDRTAARAWPHRIAVANACATFLLILAGRLVTNTGSGLAVPDWPTTFGENMFLFPWSKMVGGIFFEHSHRLLGSAVGLLTLTLGVLLWIQEPRRWVRWLGAGALLTHIGAGLDAHLATAGVVAVLVLALGAQVVRRRADLPGLARPVMLLCGLLALQLLLGLGAYLGRFTGVALPLGQLSVLAFPVAHRVNGGLTLVTSLVLALRTFRTS